MAVDINELEVGKCYELVSDNNRYLGILTSPPQIMGSGEGRIKTAIFDNKGKMESVERDFRERMSGSYKAHLFNKVDCKYTVNGGNRRKTRRARKVRRNRRYSRHK